MESAAPIQQKDRIFILDVVRGVALCGILILNIGYFAFSYIHAGNNLNVLNETAFADVASWYVTNHIAEGSFRALFSMLFGASALLIIARIQKRSEGLTTADIFYRRLIWLLIFGLINGFVFLWPGDILYTYAICGLFIFPLRNSSPKFLFALAVFFMIAIMFQGFLSIQERFEMRTNGLAALEVKEAKKDSLNEEQKAAIQKWNGYLEKRKVETQRKEVEKEVKKMQGTYTEVWSYLKSINQKMESSIFYHELFFDALLFMLLGMAFYKMGILTGEKSMVFYVSCIVIGYSLGISEGYLLGHAVRKSNYDFFKSTEYISAYWRLLYQPHRLLMALGHIGTIMTLWKLNIFNWLLKPIANVGQMAFSNYLMQSLICTFTFYGYGLSYFGKISRHDLWYFVAGVWIFQIIFSAIWLRFFSMGPFEWCWRSLTYWKAQILKK